MNMITRIKNNFQYQKYRRLREEALANIKRSEAMNDTVEFKKWLGKYIEYSKKCLEIPIS